MINEWADIALTVVIVAGVIAAFAIGFYFFLKINDIHWGNTEKYKAIISKRLEDFYKAGRIRRIMFALFVLAVGIIAVLIILQRR